MSMLYLVPSRNMARVFKSAPTNISRWWNAKAPAVLEAMLANEKTSHGKRSRVARTRAPDEKAVANRM